MISLVGLGLLIGSCALFSRHKKAIDWKMVAKGVGLQFLLGLVILKTDFGYKFFQVAKDVFQSLFDFTNVGSDFVLGGLADQKKLGFVFATMVLPTILFISSLMSILYHLGIMQKVVEIAARVMVKVLGTSGAESLAAAANVFAGQTEAPLVVRPYLLKMTQSELLALMTGGMATIAGGVLAAYVGLGISAGHLLAASVMSAPAALVCAKILLPETEVSSTQGVVKLDAKPTTVNIIDAAAAGATEGLKLALNVAAMLLCFIALIALVNGVLSLVGGIFGFEQLTLELIFGYLFSPVAFILGVPWADCMAVGSLLGKKLILNEFVAYTDLVGQAETLSPRAFIITTYALCGFANFSSIAIQVGGVGALIPERRKDLAKLGMQSLIGGTVACLMTAAIAGFFI